MNKHRSDKHAATSRAIDFTSIQRDLSKNGLFLLGGFDVGSDDRVDDDIKSILVIGNAGSALWPRFQQSSEYRDRQPHPLDRWSRRLIDQIAASQQLPAVYPFDGPPWQPFQQWARRANPNLTPSPLGMLIHPVYGLWWALRGALLLPRPFEPPASSIASPPCEACETKPCLHACPVHAFTGDSYLVDQCAGHLRTSEGRTCEKKSCLARRACPIGEDYRYQPDHAAFHMQAFLRSRDG